MAVEKIIKTSDSLPEALQDKEVKTQVRSMSNIIKEKLLQLNDLATMEVKMDVHVRMKNRLDSIRKISSAESHKIRGIWKTRNPNMHVKGLTGKKITNDTCEISFGVYDVDDKGNKKEYKNYSTNEIDGRIVKKHLSSEYKIIYEVIETIKTGKPITREVVKLDSGEK